MNREGGIIEMYENQISPEFAEFMREVDPLWYAALIRGRIRQAHDPERRARMLAGERNIHDMEIAAGERQDPCQCAVCDGWWESTELQAQVLQARVEVPRAP